MKNLVCLFLTISIVFVLSGCGFVFDNLPSPKNTLSSQDTTAEDTTESTTPTETESNSQPVQVTYEVAFNFVKKCEDNIIKNNQYDFNKYNESAAETIIYSDEYAALYCSYWRALEILDNGNDSRFGKSKMRWQIDYSSDEWTNLLIDALKAKGLSGFQDEYARLYTEEVFPKVEYRWEKGID